MLKTIEKRIAVMIIEYFTKQPYEEFYIAGCFSNVLETGETLVLAESTVTAQDNNETDKSSDVLDQATISVIDSKLQIRCKAGIESESPYKLTFRVTTSTGNKWEIDVKMNVDET